MKTCKKKNPRKIKTMTVDCVAHAIAFQYIWIYSFMFSEIIMYKNKIEIT